MLLLYALVGVLAVDFSAARAESPGPHDSAARRASDFLPAATPRHWTTIVLHHSATDGGSVESIDAVHRRQKDAGGNPWLGIGYHFVVGNGRSMGDGEIRPTFRWQKQLPGAHAGKRDENEHGIGICLIGNFDVTPPTDKQVAAVRVLVKSLATRYTIGRSRVIRHQDVGATLCPGRLFPWVQVHAEVPDVKSS
ncbi:MAG: peptidoglycan recognition family protein [Pirellulales bacterium]